MGLEPVKGGLDFIAVMAVAGLDAADGAVGGIEFANLSALWNPYGYRSLREGQSAISDQWGVLEVIGKAVAVIDQERTVAVLAVGQADQDGFDLRAGRAAD